MPELLSVRLKKWRGRLGHKEAAAILGLPVGTYRKYEYGKRTPNALAMAELERRIATPAPQPAIKTDDESLHSAW